MSWQAQAWVAQLPLDAGMNLAAFRVLDKLADVHHVDTNSAFRHLDRLATELRCTKRTVQRALRDLELLGFIRKGNQKVLGHLDPRYRPTVYELSMDLWQPQAEQPQLEGATAVVTPEQPVDNSSRGDKNRDLGVTTAVALGTKGRTTTQVPRATTDRAPKHEHEHSWVDTNVGAFCADRDCGIRRDGAKRIDWDQMAVRPIRRSA